MVQTRSISSLIKTISGFCASRPFSATLIFILTVTFVFLTIPALDIWITRLFYAGDHVFPAARSPLWNKVRYLGVHITQWVAGLALFVMLFKLAFPKLKALLDLRAPLFLLSTLIIGPGIVTNAILKNNWGRPRPRSTEIFGGDLPFIGVWEPTNYCDSNCSFVSGEGSSSFWLFTLVFIVPKSWRIPVASVIAVLCTIFSTNRVAFGGHFTSDTLLSWGITMLVILSVHWYLYKRTPVWAQPDHLDTSFTKAGSWLHTKIGSAACLAATSTRSFLQKFR